MAARCTLPSTHTSLPPHYEPMSPLFHSGQAIWTDAVMSCCLFGYRLSQMRHDAVTQISWQQPRWHWITIRVSHRPTFDRKQGLKTISVLSLVSLSSVCFFFSLLLLNLYLSRTWSYLHRWLGRLTVGVDVPHIIHLPIPASTIIMCCWPLCWNNWGLSATLKGT